MTRRAPRAAHGSGPRQRCTGCRPLPLPHRSGDGCWPPPPGPRRPKAVCFTAARHGGDDAVGAHAADAVVFPVGNIDAAVGADCDVCRSHTRSCRRTAVAAEAGIAVSSHGKNTMRQCECCGAPLPAVAQIQRLLDRVIAMLNAQAPATQPQWRGRPRGLPACSTLLDSEIVAAPRAPVTMAPTPSGRAKLF